MHNQKIITEVAIFTVKPEFQDKIAEIRIGLRDVLKDFNGLISLETLVPAEGGHVFADIAKWQSLSDAKTAAFAFESGDERFKPYMQAIDDVKFMGHFEE